jgi:hypothetical protein
MNSLSWFLYIADVIGNIGVIVWLVGGACAAFCVICVIAQAASEGQMSKDCPSVWKYWWRCATAAVVFFILAGLFPSQKTIYAIAASQFGERIAASEQVQGIASDATKALQAWIKKQIEPETKK